MREQDKIIISQYWNVWSDDEGRATSSLKPNDSRQLKFQNLHRIFNDSEDPFLPTIENKIEESRTCNENEQSRDVSMRRIKRRKNGRGCWSLKWKNLKLKGNEFFDSWDFLLASLDFARFRINSELNRQFFSLNPWSGFSPFMICRFIVRLSSSQVIWEGSNEEDIEKIEEFYILYIYICVMRKKNSV